MSKSTVHIVDRHIFQTLPQSEKDRIEAGLQELGVALDDAAEAYTDEAGKVVGALRFLRNEQGHKYAVDDEVATELVGVTP